MQEGLHSNSPLILGPAAAAFANLPCGELCKLCSMCNLIAWSLYILGIVVGI